MTEPSEPPGSGQPVWGTPSPPRVQPPAGQRFEPPAQQPSTYTLGIRRTPRGIAPPEPDRASLHRQAKAALVINLIVAVCCFGLLSIPGAIMAGLALQAIGPDPYRSTVLLRWSWAFLAANLVFYALLIALGVAVAVFALTVSDFGS